MVMLMKQHVRQTLSHRLPVIELNIIGALLDPSQRNLTVVQDFLIGQDTTAFHLLSPAMDKYIGANQQLHANNNLSGLNELGSIIHRRVCPVSISSFMEKGKHDLLSKHVNFTGTVDRDIQLYRCLSIVPDDVKAWWNSQKDILVVIAMMIARQNNIGHSSYQCPN